MRDFDEIDRIFRIVDEMFSRGFSGGYTKSNYTDTTGHVDINEDDDHIYLTLEIKVANEDLEVKPSEYDISLEIMSEGSWRKKTFRLPCKVKPETAIITFNNYILDITLDKDNSEDNKITENDKKIIEKRLKELGYL